MSWVKLISLTIILTNSVFIVNLQHFNCRTHLNLNNMNLILTYFNTRNIKFASILTSTSDDGSAFSAINYCNNLRFFVNYFQKNGVFLNFHKLDEGFFDKQTVLFRFKIGFVSFIDYLGRNSNKTNQFLEEVS